MNRQRTLRAVGLFGLLVAIYFLTYSGQAISTDELVLFDGVHSLFRNGSLELAYTSDLRPYTLLPANRPVTNLDLEPMQAYLATPLLWLAARLPGIGMVQAVWLFNIIVTALTAVVLYYYGTALGYRDGTALSVAALFGLATSAWPYSALFFREPLFTLFAVLCAYGLERWREHLDQGRLRLAWFLLAALSLVGALFTKEAGLLIVPTMLVAALPGVTRRLFNRRAALAVAALLAVVVLAVLIYRQVVPNSRFSNILDRLSTLSPVSFQQALPAYLFSPGFSLWAFSPVLLLGLAGAYLLLNARRVRQLFVPLAMLLSIIVGYSVFQVDRWYGGTAWGPRYLLPIVPFVSLWLLPVVDSLLARTAPIGAQAIAVGVIAQSVLIQILAVIVPIKAFGNYLYFEGVSLHRPIPPWIDGVWNPLYIPSVVTAHQAESPSPIAWIVNGSGALVVPLCLAVAGIGLYVLARRCPSRREVWLGTGAVALGILIMFYAGLRSYYTDPRYVGSDAEFWPALWSVLDTLNAELRPGDAVILNDGAYRDFMMNYYKRLEPVYTMPLAPGEQLEEGKPPEIVTSNPDERPNPYTTMLCARLALNTSRWWFLTEFNPFSPGRLRPVEQFLVQHYFPVDEAIKNPTARLLLFAPISAPQSWVPPWPQYQADADFGAAKLVGYDLPRGTEIMRGTMLPVSLLWRHDGWPGNLEPFDYSVNVSLISAEGAAVAQHAAQPLGTFAPMSHWVSGGYYRDNHALELPASLAPGDYELWVLIFDWRNGKNLPIDDGTGKPPGDHLVITKIRVTE